MTTREPPPHNPPAQIESGGYARLARRISGWTSRLLICAVMLVLFLGLGRELSSWFGFGSGNHSAEQQPPIVGPELARSSVLEFGDSAYALDRDVIRGGQQAALAQMRLRCREWLSRGAQPAGPATEAEARLLLRVRNLKPVEDVPGIGRVYEFVDGLPTVLGIRDVPHTAGCCGEDITQPNKAQGKESTTAAVTDPRLVVWSMALPTAPPDESVPVADPAIVPADSATLTEPAAWTTYTCRAATGFTGIAQPAIKSLIPPDCRRSLALGDAQGRTIVGFQGGTTDASMRFYSDRRPELNGQARDWQELVPWQKTGGVWQARYRATIDARPMLIDVQLFEDVRRSHHGLLTLNQAAPAKGTKE